MEANYDIYRQMLDAITEQAFYKYEFDVTTGIIDMEILLQNGFSLSNMMGLTPPFEFESMVKHLEAQGFQTFCDGKIQSFGCEDLIRTYESGKKSFEAIIHSTNPETYIKMTFLLARNEADNHIRSYVIARDITSIKMNEEKTALEREEFRHQKDLELKEALEKAREASSAKSKFLFSMSHDLRTPMNAILGYSHLMETHWQDRDASFEYLQKLNYSSKFLLSLINDVLEMARIESGKEELNETIWTFDSFGKTIESVIEGDLNEKHLEFVRNVDIQHSAVYCDAIKMREIMLNLLSNAIKYTPAGGKIEMDVKELPCDKEGYINVQTIISDTGIGMSEEFLPHIFESFSRERNTSQSGVNGTGLGMSIVKSLIEIMGGTISVESKLGKGSKFTIVLPHRYIQDDQLLQQEDKKKIDYDLLKGKRILVAEDNDLNAEIATTILTDLGFICDHAADGEVALQKIKKHRIGYYDLVLMDIQMPHMDGYEATVLIRQIENDRCNTPIIAMTANAFEEDRQKAMEMGMNGHIGKPIEIDKLLETIYQVLCQKY